MKTLTRSLSVLGALMLSTAAMAQDGQIRIGVLNDQSSSFSALGGAEVVEAVRLAIADFGGQVLGQPITMVSADHQNQPDVGLSIAREWLQADNVDIIVDMANSAISLGINTLIGEEGKVGIFVSPLTDRPTEADCNGHVMAWAYDAYSTVGTSVNAQLMAGRRTFFVISPDYEAGRVQESWVRASVEAGGGEVLGAVSAPLGTTDFSSFILQAQASGAEVIQINLNGPELINALKQIQEFGLIDMGQTVAVTFLHQSDARAIGAESLQGIQFAAPWFWELNDESVAFSERMRAITGHAPGWIAAGNYSAVSNYLEAVQLAGTDDADAVLAAMAQIPLDDMFLQNATLFPNGRVVHDMHLLQVQAPGDMQGDDDFFRLVTTVPAATAFRPLSATTCPLVSQ